MGLRDILGGVKNRLMGRANNDDIDDIRSYVTGDENQQSFPREEEPPKKPWEREPIASETESFSPPLDAPHFDRRDLSLDKQGTYELMDRLNIIESQLAAIRSQTETINERLKNLEFRITGGRRF